MATKKPAASKTTALVPWEQEMAAAAAKQASKEKPAGISKAISIRGGVLSIDDNPVEDNELRVIVLASVHENQYYTGAYNPNTPQIPTCYSFGDPEADEPEDSMAPHPDAEEAQSEACANCWANEFGSADAGRGKACKNVRRLVMITEDALESADDLSSAEVRILKVPVMSVKNWGQYVRSKLGTEINRPHWAVVTKIKVVPDPKSQFKVQFSFEELINFDQDLYDAMKKKIVEVTEQATQPYQKPAEEPAPPPRGGRNAKAQPMKPVGRAAKAQPMKPVGRAAKAQPMKPVGRAAQAMAKKPAGKPAPAAKRGKF